MFSGFFVSVLEAFLSVPFVSPPSSPRSAAKVLPCHWGERVLPLDAAVFLAGIFAL